MKLIKYFSNSILIFSLVSPSLYADQAAYQVCTGGVCNGGNLSPIPYAPNIPMPGGGVPGAVGSGAAISALFNNVPDPVLGAMDLNVANINNLKNYGTQVAQQGEVYRQQAENFKQQAQIYEQNAKSLRQQADNLKNFHAGSVSTLTAEEVIARRPVAPRPIIDLNALPDTPEADLPFKFQSTGEFRQESIRLYQDLYKANPQYGKQKRAREYGLLAVEVADKAYAEGDTETAYSMKDVATGLLDVTVGLDPLTGFGRSAYELFSGKNLITGLELGQFERGIAFIGVITAGTGTSAINGSKGILRLAQRASQHIPSPHAIQSAVAEGSRLAIAAGDTLKGWGKNHKITSIISGAEMNALVNRPADFSSYNPLTYVVQFNTIRDSFFARVHYGVNEAGSWLLRKSSIRGLTAEQIQKKYALPFPPTHISDVHVPGGTAMSRGGVQYHQIEPHWPKEDVARAIQYRLEQQIPVESFKNVKPIGKVFEE